MAREVDPYQQWFGLRPEEDLNHYRLLDLPLFEADTAVIQAAADRRKTQIDAHRTGDQAPLAALLCARISAAAACLLEPSRKTAYDADLRHELRMSAKRIRRRRRQIASVVIPIGIAVLLIVGLLLTNPWRARRSSDPGSRTPLTEERSVTKD